MNDGGVSPKLKATMKKISNILKKEDLGGVVFITDGNENFEYRLHFTDPSWSTVRMLKDDKGKPKGFHLKVYMESLRVETERTVNMIMGFRDLVAGTFDTIDKLIQRIESSVDVEVGETKHTPGE